MKYRYTYTITDRWNVEIEADSPEEAEEKFFDKDGMADLVDLLSPDDHEETLDPENEKEPSPIHFSETELLRLSDCVLQAIANNNRAAALVFDPAIIKQIETGNQALRKLNSKICSMMKGSE